MAEDELQGISAHLGNESTPSKQQKREGIGQDKGQNAIKHAPGEHGR